MSSTESRVRPDAPPRNGISGNGSLVGALAREKLFAGQRKKHRRGWLVRRLLLAADIVALLSAFFITEAIFMSESGLIRSVGIGVETVIFVATLPGWVVAAKLYGLYDRDMQKADPSTVEEFPSIFHMVTVVVWGFYALSWMTGLTDPSQVKLATFWLLTIGSLTTARGVARFVARRRPQYVQNALIVGAGDVGQLIGRKLLNHPEYRLNPIGFVDADPKERRDDLGDLALLGSLERVPELVRTYDVERVIVAFSNESHEALLDVIRSLKHLDVQVDIVPRLFEIVGPRLTINSVEGVPIITIPPVRLSRSSRLLKRALDVTVALAGLVLLAPFVVLTALLIRLDSRGPVLFTQVRMGANDRTFRMLKLRTMVEDAELQKSALDHLNKHARGDVRMFKVPGDPRVTRMGRFLRRFSLDELPQLYNVLKGEMSLVGPRPLILAEDEYVSTWARRRLALRPGITGVWQILGRTDIPFAEMVTLDYLYVTNWTLAGDLKILARTIPAILRSQDAY